MVQVKVRTVLKCSSNIDFMGKKILSFQKTIANMSVVAHQLIHVADM